MKYSVQLEPWSDELWAEMKPLAEAHAREVDEGVEPRRRFKLDQAQMMASASAGVLRVVIGRLDGRVIGYFTWGLGMDVESEGLLIAMQGAWYAEPGHWRLAVMLFDQSIATLKALGVQCIFPHHRVQGRGSHLGKFFKRRGAKKIQDSYCLWIGD